MDFSIIDGLTDEELNELYDDNVIQDPDSIYASGCLCHGYKPYFMHFGYHSPTSAPCSGNLASCGYCGITPHGYEACSQLCLSNNSHMYVFNTGCTCTERGGHYTETWSTCRR